MGRKSDHIKAFEHLVVDYQPRLSAYVRHFVKSESDVNDIVQDSFMSLWKSYPERVDDYPHIIFAITRNKCLNWLRHHRLESSVLVQTSPGEELLFNKDFGFSSSDAPYLYQELQKQVASVLDSLTPRCREVFQLSRFEHNKNREIAQKLGISESAVEKHIRHALNAFSEALKESDSIYFILLVSVWLMS